MAKRNKNKKKLPTLIELIQGTRSPLAFEAIFRSGGGTHQDRRTKRNRTRSAQKQAALNEY